MNAKRPWALEEMLPFARAALKNYETLRSPFELFHFADGLSFELEKVGAEGVVKAAIPNSIRTRFNYSGNYPLGLKEAIGDVFWHLVHQGYLLPTWRSFPDDPGGIIYRRTERGAQWANGAEPMPEDTAGYLRHLDELVPTLDKDIRQYVSEGLGSFSRSHYLSAAVMLGAASEKEIYLLGESMAPALKESAKQKLLTELVNKGRQLNQLLELIAAQMQSVKKAAKNSAPGLADGSPNYLASLFESIRVQRNEAVHPQVGAVSESSVRMSYAYFPEAVLKAEELREWCRKNPNAL
jgi:hypothetical protein